MIFYERLFQFVRERRATMVMHSTATGDWSLSVFWKEEDEHREHTVIAGSPDSAIRALLALVERRALTLA